MNGYIAEEHGKSVEVNAILMDYDHAVGIGISIGEGQNMRREGWLLSKKQAKELADRIQKLLK